MTPERWNFTRLSDAVRKASKPVVSKNTDGTFSNIGLGRLARMDGQSYLVTETMFEIIVDMGSAKKEAQ